MPTTIRSFLSHTAPVTHHPSFIAGLKSLPTFTFRLTPSGRRSRPYHQSLVTCLLCLLLGAAAGSSAAQSLDSALTIYAAYRDGGSFTDATIGSTLPIEASGAGSISLDLGLDATRQVQLFVSRQSSQLNVQQASAPIPPGGTVPGKLPMRVTYLHVGGTNFLEGRIGRGAYVMGGLGATLFEPGGEGFENELRPSMNLGIGYQLPLGERFALRIEARGYFTLVDSSGGMFCSGGCTISIKGDTMSQGDVQLGLSFRF
jgi:hypothetical protein